MFKKKKPFLTHLMPGNKKKYFGRTAKKTRSGSLVVQCNKDCKTLFISRRNNESNGNLCSKVSLFFLIFVFWKFKKNEIWYLYDL